jgi:hypothetical protein
MRNERATSKRDLITRERVESKAPPPTAQVGVQEKSRRNAQIASRLFSIGAKLIFEILTVGVSKIDKIPTRRAQLQREKERPSVLLLYFVVHTVRTLFGYLHCIDTHLLPTAPFAPIRHDSNRIDSNLFKSFYNNARHGLCPRGIT